jgi:hypothetical protein
MALLVGQPIDARELEQATSQWSPERFASMCDALVWAASGRRCSKFPSFTMRVNAADRGVDAEWEVEVSEDGGGLPTPIVGTGWNVFQYKKRDLIAQDRRRIVSNLRSSLRKALAGVATGRHRHPDRYVVFLNVDLKHDQTVALKEAITEDYERSTQTEVVIVGAGGLAALLNNYPHLRAAYFAPLSFKTWEEANCSHRAQKLFGFDVALVGREDLLKQLRSFVDDPQVHAIVVTGPHDIGKSRLVLEATSHRRHDVVFALDPRSMRLDDYRKLVAEQRDVVCIVEDPNPDDVEGLVSEVLGVERLKVIITLPSSAQAPLVSYGRDERIQSLFLGPLTDEDARKLLNATGKHLDFGVESWILDHAWGSPGILLVAASIGENLRDERDDFEASVGREFAKRIESQLGADALKCAELLSLLTHVGVFGEFESELKLICEIFGEGQWQPARVLSALESLERAGLARRGGSFAEITTPLLANHLVTRLLRGRRDDEIFALFARLHEPARIRFLRRLCYIKSQEVERFWNALFDPNDPQAPFGNFGSALRQAHMLRLIAGTVPERTVKLLESGLLGTRREERLAIKDEPRRELMWALEELLFRSKTSLRALGCLAMLAEAETENYGNNATGVFCESFHPLHPQLPLPLQERLSFLTGIFGSEHSQDLRLLCINAIESALSRTGAIRLRRTTGPEPLDSRPHMTYGEVWDYIEALVDLVMTAAQSEEPALAEQARNVLPRAIAEGVIQGRPETGVARFRTVTEWLQNNTVPISVADLNESLRIARDALHETIGKVPDEVAVRLSKGVTDIDDMLTSIDRGDFASKLKRWAGRWARDDHDYEMGEGGRRLYRRDRQLQALAEEAVKNPQVLTGVLLNWLCSADAKKAYMFFRWLGRVDSERKWLPKIEELGGLKNGLIAFSAYFGGLSRSLPAFVSERLDELVESREVMAEAIVNATGYLRGGLAGVERMERLIQEKRVDPKYVEHVLSGGGWIDSLAAKEYLRLLKAIAGPQLENVAAAIDFLGMWLHNEKPIEGELAEFAWRCLEAAPPVAHNDTYDFNQVASRLAQVDPDRGFKLLESLLTQPSERQSWNPIDRYGARESGFWDVLHKVDRERALRIVLSLAKIDPVRQFQLTWDFRDIVDQEGDQDLLIKLALEDEKQAEVIARSITTAHPGFWPIAFKIIEKYPGNERIESALTGGIEQQGKVHVGPYSQHLESCRKVTERVLNDPKTPPTARLWLRAVLSRFETDIAQHVIWEYDQDVNDLRRHIKDKESPERIWAIGRVLKYADLKHVRRLLSVEDIVEALPQVNLPERKRKALERAVEVWQSGN